MGFEDGEGLTYSTPKTSTNQYGTPPSLIRKLERALGGRFDLDPCSGSEVDPIAEERYTKEDDGLSQPWFGNVFVNPPFSEVGDWVRKAYDEQRNGDAERVVMLLPVRLATGYFHDHITDADAICFLRGRLDYYNGDGEMKGAPFASYLVVFGDAGAFMTLFEQHGTVFTDSGIYKSQDQLSVRDF